MSLLEHCNEVELFSHVTSLLKALCAKYATSSGSSSLKIKYGSLKRLLEEKLHQLEVEDDLKVSQMHKLWPLSYVRTCVRTYVRTYVIKITTFTANMGLLLINFMTLYVLLFCVLPLII